MNDAAVDKVIFQNSLTLNQSPIFIDRDIGLASGGFPVVLTGTNAHRALELTPDIFSLSTLTIDNLTFEQFSTPNSAIEPLSSRYSGGAVYGINTSGIRNSQFSENSASFNGGAVRIRYFNGDLFQSTFTQNSVLVSDDVSVVFPGGGALSATDFTGDIIGSRFVANTVNTLPAIIADNRPYGGAVHVQQFKGNITRSVFEANIAGDASTTYAGAGALWIRNFDGKITDSLFNNNTSYGHGGAIAHTEADTEVHNARFVDNHGIFGGVLSVANSSLPNNLGKVTVDGSMFISNDATGAQTYHKNYAPASGGVFFLSAGQTDLRLENSVFLNNSALTGRTIDSIGGWGGVVHLDLFKADSALSLSATNGEQLLFYGNRHNAGNGADTVGLPNALHFSNTANAGAGNNRSANVTVDADAKSRILMLDAFSSQQDGMTGFNPSGTLLTFANVASVITKQGVGDWFLGGVSDMRGASTWNITDGRLNLVTTNYGGAIGVLDAVINLSHANSQFTLDANATLQGSGTIKANGITLEGTVTPDTWVNTGTLAPNLQAQIDTISNTVTTAVNADGSVAAADKLATINTQIRQQANALVDVTQSDTVGKLSLEGAVTMNNATYNVDFDYNSGTPVVDLIDINGALTTTGTNAINVNSVSFYNGVIPASDAAFFNNIAPIIQTTGGITGTPFELRIGGALGTSVDYAQVYGDISNAGKDYSLGVGLSWFSTTKNTGGIDQAHGTFTLAGAGDSFTINGALSDRNGLNGTWDGKSLTKKGTGTLVLNGANTYTGLTDVQAGTLMLGDATHPGASVEGNVDVHNGARLSGFGTVKGKVSFASGTGVSPGDAGMGVLTVGELALQNGSTYALDVDHLAQSDRIDVKALTGSGGVSSGQATIYNGAQLAIRSLGSNLPADWNLDTIYTIIATDNGVITSGSNTPFVVTNNPFPFLDPTVIYNANTVQLRMQRNDSPFANICNPNPCDVGGALDDLDVRDPLVKAVLALTAEDARAAYRNLSGEIYASTRTSLLSDRKLRDVLTHRMLGQIKDSAGQHLWVDTWGQTGRIQGKGDVAKINTSGLGLALGVDHQFTSTLLAGAFFAYEDHKVKQGDFRNARSDVDAYSAGTYAVASLGNFTVRGGLSYSRLDVDTRREIAVGTLQGQVRSKARGNKVQALAEVAHPFVLNDTVEVSPYVNLAQVWLRTNAAHEAGNAAALAIARQRDSVRFGTLGLRFAANLATQTPLQITLDTGWVRAFGDIQSKTTNRFAGRTAGFDTRGVGVAKNTALVGVGLQAQLAVNTHVSVNYQAQLGSAVRQHTGQVQFSMGF